MKSIHDSPDGAEEAYEWGYGAGYCEPGHVAFEAGYFFVAGDLHGALNRDGAALPTMFGEASFKHGYQRAGFELFRYRRDILQALGFAEGAHEASALYACPAYQTPLGKNNGPGDHAENQEYQKNDLGDGTGFSNQIDDLSANHESGSAWGQPAFTADTDGLAMT